MLFVQQYGLEIEYSKNAASGDFHVQMYSMVDEREPLNNVIFYTMSGFILISLIMLMVIATRKRQLRMAREEYIFVKLF